MRLANPSIRRLIQSLRRGRGEPVPKSQLESWGRRSGGSDNCWPTTPALMVAMYPVFPIVLGIIGVGVAVTGCLDLRFARRIAAWPIARGRLISAELSGAPFGPGNVVIKAHYHYRVGAVDYEGCRFTFRRFVFVMEARRALFRVSATSALDVYYDPERPDRAVLLRGAGYRPGLAVVGGILMVAVAVTLHWIPISL